MVDYQFSLSFSYDFEWPAGMSSWTSQATGDEYFSFSYIPSEFSQKRLDNHELNQEVFWEITDVKPNEISFSIKLSQEDYYDFTDRIILKLSPFFTRKTDQICDKKT